MEGSDGAAVPGGPAVEGRPWWAALVGVGSLGVGGVQVLGGGLAVALAAVGPGTAAVTIALAGGTWILPGALLAVAGFGVLQDRAWARPAALVAVAAFAGSVAGLAAIRSALPPAIADAAEWARARPEAPPALVAYMDESVRRSGVDPLVVLRDPESASRYGAVYAGICCAPVFPWYALLFALALRRRAAGPPVA